MFSIIFFGVAGIVAIFFLVFLLIRNKKNQQRQADSDTGTRRKI
ncbi:MAG TPA: hypothetical protein VHB48_08740 [Chitinophagaceae bacterium]|jgi:hypothetical protein|nr:hypothetical protein [Chitinophagaceae bacterium]